MMYIVGSAFIVVGAGLVYFHIDEGGKKEDTISFVAGAIILIIGIVLSINSCS